MTHLNKADAIKSEQLSREVMASANEKYASKKTEKGLCGPCTAPECMPTIVSDQVSSIVETIVELLILKKLV